MSLTVAPCLHRQVLKQLAETHKSRPFSYLWVEAGAQPGLEAAVGVGGCSAHALLQAYHCRMQLCECFAGGILQVRRAWQAGTAV